MARAKHGARLLAYGAALLLALVLLLLGLVLQRQPAVVPDIQPAHQYLSATRSLIHRTVRSGAGDVRQKRLVLTAEDLTAAANFALLRKRLEGFAVCTIRNHRLELKASLRLPLRWVGPFLNIRLTAEDGEPQAVIKRLRLGRLSVPSPVVGWPLALSVSRAALAFARCFFNSSASSRGRNTVTSGLSIPATA